MHISPEIPQNKKKNGARDQDMEKQTVELLKAVSYTHLTLPTKRIV